MREQLKRAREWKEFRKKYYLTQRELGRLLGCDRLTVLNVERCKVKNGSYRVLGRFAALKKKYEGYGKEWPALEWGDEAAEEREEG